MALKIIKKGKNNLPICSKYGYVTKSKLTQKYMRRLWDKQLEQKTC